MYKNPKLAPDIKAIIVVASGKGGVGKSTVAAGLALALAGRGLKTGLLDADIYGPSQPKMMGLEGYKPEQKDGKIQPPLRHGIKVISIGFMVDADKALIWRGPMVQTAIYQLFRDVDWGTKEEPLDVLIVDMPPGTGDAQLTIAQKIPVAGAVIVSTPQDIALIDARKAIAMFQKTDVPILGIIENMSTHICSNCGHEEHIFGHGGAKLEAEKLSVPFLGEIPLSRVVREQSDAGEPFRIDQAIVDKILLSLRSDEVDAAIQR
jgi:ATP-binding protein involved in chromosome partitioning